MVKKSTNSPGRFTKVVQAFIAYWVFHVKMKKKKKRINTQYERLF